MGIWELCLVHMGITRESYPSPMEKGLLCRRLFPGTQEGGGLSSPPLFSQLGAQVDVSLVPEEVTGAEALGRTRPGAAGAERAGEGRAWGSLGVNTS